MSDAFIFSAARARAAREGTCFFILDDPILSGDEDYRALSRVREGWIGKPRLQGYLALAAQEWAQGTSNVKTR